MDQYQSFIHKSRYARYLDDHDRRETWEETVNRYVDFWGLDTEPTAREGIRKAITNMDVMPSMRCMMTAGAALERDNVAGYNCSYLPIDNPRCFDELMYILLCGTGVGFSVENHYINKLPEVADEFHTTETTIIVSDSKIGWASAFRELISLLYAGKIPKCDLTRIRPKGARLKTFGGRASGPQPLSDLFNFTVDLFRGAQKRKLTDLECHDLVCKIADVVVVGGVRRSALISLGDLNSVTLRNAKSGAYPQHRILANNSAVYVNKPNFDTFFGEMSSLYLSYSGERGIFSRNAAQNVAARNGRRDSTREFGTNPCSEIILRPFQFCNLSEVVARADDTKKTLKAKVKHATIIGTLQATLTDFRYLRGIWKKNAEEEALLGVSITGIMDCPLLNGMNENELDKLLAELQTVAIETNKEWAAKLGINASAAITCVKPSGTVSQLVNSASGIHPRFSPYYIRRVKLDSRDPLGKAMIEGGFPHEQDITNEHTYIFSFPVAAPEGCITAESMGALEQLELWKSYQDNWCEHKPSMTCYYRQEEFLDVCKWVWDNFDCISGIAFLPYDGGTYQQAPYEQITKEKYEELEAAMPVGFDWNIEELEDATTGTQELACSSGVCEL